MTDNRTAELTAMERFRTALEKRGIEFETNDDECAYGEPRCTVFKAHIGGDRETDIVIVGVKDWYFDGKLTPWLDVEFHNVLTLEQAIASTLGEPIIRCRDCKHATISTTGVCKYCEMFVLPDVDGYGADPQVNLPLDFFCGFAERKEVD